MQEINNYLTFTHQFHKFYTEKISRAAEDFGMSKIEMDVLLFLYNNPGLNTAKEIVELRHIAKSYVSKAVDLLGRRGYIVCSEDEKDRRVIRLNLSAAAVPAAKRAREEQEKTFRLMFRGVTDSEQAVLRGMMEKISSNIKEES